MHVNKHHVTSISISHLPASPPLLPQRPPPRDSNYAFYWAKHQCLVPVVLLYLITPTPTRPL